MIIYCIESRQYWLAAPVIARRIDCVESSWYWHYVAYSPTLITVPDLYIIDFH